MGEIISFYSYKGGVGRSMALANVATLLAQRGHRVLVVDFDLEAPGLHRYFLGVEPHSGKPRQAPLKSQRGTIDLFVELYKSISDGRGSKQDIVASLLDSNRFGYSVRVGFPTGTRTAELHFLSAGLFDEGYAQLVHDFPWSRFYEDSAEVFTHLAEEWKRRYEYVLLDSRTGISDLGSVSTVILADKLVLAFTPNQQSLHGVTELGRQAVALKGSLDSAGPLALFPLLSRVDEGEETQCRHWIGVAVDRFEALFEASYGHCDIDFPTYFDAVRIPHRGYYAYGEKIAVEQERPATLGSLAEGYMRFLDCLGGKDLSGWQGRIRNAIRPRRDIGALVVSFETPFDPPVELDLDHVVKIPENPLPGSSARLRTIPVDEEAWSDAVGQIDRGLQRALSMISGELHVFATLPYPTAVYLGRRLDDMARTRPILLYQFDPIARDWILFFGPSRVHRSSTKSYYQLVEKPSREPEQTAVLLALEGMRPISKELLASLARSLGAPIYHLKAETEAPLQPDEVPQAVVDLRHALLHIQKQHPTAPLHIVTTAPVALLIELGRMLTPTVYGSVVVYQFEPTAGNYVPVLDVLQRAVLSPHDTP